MTQPFIRITTAKAAALALFAARGTGLPRPPAGAARSDAFAPTQPETRELT
ncbi:hypothetical protein [Actibacterium sp.]|jgi:hypothetical protein|uniref:hypothetical protein n=1 Tax=Actibacterium sp. TaxID=1872125 RepID=UPI00257D7DE7|nr:hypothetical protein [Actibacterium sp.]|tara:strand:+ start:1108 stop:1260 length:153 start_codon:yes stop_codon:yes gene_type:complete